MVALRTGPLETWRTLRSRPTMEMVRYAEFRLLGHPVLETLMLPLLNVVRHQLEREPGPILGDMGKGPQPQGLPPQRFDGAGVPRASQPGNETTEAGAPTRQVATVEALQAALADARAGDTVEIAPGTYRIDSPLFTGRAGEPGRPITLRAARLDSVHLLVTVPIGLVINRPHWLVENLEMRGDCAAQARCEDAIRVIGPAFSTVIRNNRFSEFNVHVKVAGDDGTWPDDGLLQFNAFVNEQPRSTDTTVAAVDIAGADDWQVVDNLVKGSVKSGGNAISFGVTLSGGGSRGRVERNLVVCTPHGISQPGLRVGISVGGVGRAKGRSCRDGRCEAEHWDAVVANNVVAHCNDVGIDVNHSQRTLVAFNTLVNTLGVLVREKPSTATVQGILLEGSIRIRNGGELRQDHNLIVSRLGDVLADPDALDLRWRELPAMLPAHPMVSGDFCARRRPNANPPGATLSATCVVNDSAAKP